MADRRDGPFRQRTGAAGRRCRTIDHYSPGGECIERDVLMLDDVTVSLITERRESQPWGLDTMATSRRPRDCRRSAPCTCGPATCGACPPRAEAGGECISLIVRTA